MTEKHSDHTSDETTADITSAFRADFSEPDAPATARAHGAVSGIDELASGSALIVVKRGPNAGSRFVLDQPVTSAGRHPNSDIFCDDITVSRRHAEFRRQNSEFRSSTGVRRGDRWGCRKGQPAGDPAVERERGEIPPRPVGGADSRPTTAVAAAAAHLDHVEDLALLHASAENGVSSAMLDAAKLDYDANVEATKAAVEWAHQRGMFLEAELGEVGGKDGAHVPGVRTDPAEAAARVARLLASPTKTSARP